MGKSKVAILRCDNYDPDGVEAVVRRGIELLGGADLFVKAGETILLKPNLLVAEVPDKCVTTHPSVFRAVVRVLSETGAKLVFGDSPAFGSPKRVAKKAGILEVAEALGVELVDFLDGQRVDNPKGTVARNYVIANGVLASDGLVSLPKMKTHALERMTGAIKNQFGCIPGILKGEFHVKIPDAVSFGKLLVEINQFIGPRLYVMDGIMAMEGNGPRGGNPFPMNAIIMSADPVALDATVCRMVEISPEYVPPILYGNETGMGVYREEDIELLGDELNQFRSGSFKIKRRPVSPLRKGGLWTFLNRRMVSKAVINPGECTRCGTCVSMCPVEGKAVKWPTRDHTLPPVYDYNKCISCYCCQEVCPEGAVHLKTPFLRKVADIF